MWGIVCSLTLPNTVVLPHVIALEVASELSMFSTGLGFLRLGGGFGGDDEAVMEKGRGKLRAKLDASPELALRKDRGFSGEVDKLWL